MSIQNSRGVARGPRAFDDLTKAPTPIRVHILGCSGSGKSTLARDLELRTSVKPTELDDLYWLPGSVRRSDDEVKEQLTRLAATDQWIAIGDYPPLPQEVLWPRATDIVVLDLPLLITMVRLLRRTAKASCLALIRGDGIGIALHPWLGRNGVMRNFARTWLPQKTSYRTLSSFGGLDHTRVTVLRSCDDVELFLNNLEDSGIHVRCSQTVLDVSR